MAAQTIGSGDYMKTSPVKSAGQDPIDRELIEFWADAWGPYMLPPHDGMHPKALCAKLLNDVLGYNANKFRYQNREGTNMILEQIERAFEDVGVIDQGRIGQIGADEKVRARRILLEDLTQSEGLRKQLDEKGGLKNWARSVLPRDAFDIPSALGKDY